MRKGEQGVKGVRSKKFETGVKGEFRTTIFHNNIRFCSFIHPKYSVKNF